MYNHSNQYRCTIIRGKSQSEIDNMLPAYASVLDDICPCKLEAFPKRFNEKFSIYLSSDKRTKKTRMIKTLKMNIPESLPCIKWRPPKSLSLSLIHI